MQRISGRRARGTFYTVTGGVICLSALAVALMTVTPCRAEIPRDEKSLKSESARSSKRAARATGVVARKAAWTTTTSNGAILRAGRGNESVILKSDGQLYTKSLGGGVASPVGSTYSIHHRVGAMIDSGNGLEEACFDIGSINDPTDYVVSFDGAAETLRQDIFLTTATANETDTPQGDGSRIIVITTSSPTGTDLFPGGVFVGAPLTDACFSIGLDDPLTWDGVDTIDQAIIQFFKDGSFQTSADVTAMFSSPWDGVFDISLSNAAGLGYNGVRLEIQTSKSFTPANDLCADRILLTDGLFSFTTIGASTDGNEEFPVCDFGGNANVNSDIWYGYTATCTGDLIVDLCNSAYDTKVAVYEDCGRCYVDSPVACNDDWCGLKSSLGPDNGRDPVPVVQGSCYTIRVGGRQGVTGSGNGTMLIECRDASDVVAACCTAGSCTSKREVDCVSQQGTWFETESCGLFECPIPPPSNDECVAAIELTTGVAFNGTTVASTGTDVSSCGLIDTDDIWHSWTADCSGLPIFETCGSAFDTTLSVFDGCGGVELNCNDDNCGVQSKVGDVVVTEGETYYIRVSGHNGATGNYRALVTGCKNACCLDGGGCVLATPELCNTGGGVPSIGQVCGDFNDDGIQDACAGCPPEPHIINSDPFTGAVDARRPYAQETPLAREGAGSLAEPILLLLTPDTDGLEGCFSLCETTVDPDLGANGVASVIRLVNGLYQLELDHAITAGAATMITYIGDGSSTAVISHPGNVNADGSADWQDVQSLIDCCLEQTCTPAWAERSCDVDRSGTRSPFDILTTIDVLLGAGSWDAWNGTSKPSIASCP